ncbi:MULTISPECIES: type IV pilus twitching motility protein PilT [unclassified Thioalkalivibrio]|uniref:type IV pilus twitching motility protein PilT n=1 Tax=unclassified Thioalkalivibrio TaxID=2621013 RepID=UPI0003758E71|nr:MULTISPECIES: ATPase, T2SS/T4P/T4SS family [unclassified Thioalkalivibrio]
MSQAAVATTEEPQVDEAQEPLADLLKRSINVPLGFSGPELNEILQQLEELEGFDDLYISTDMRMIVKLHGHLYPIGKAPLSYADVEMIINFIYGDNGAAEVYRGNEIDTSHDFQASRKVSYRYRVNAVGIRSKSSTKGIQITMRSIKSDPMHIEDLGVENEVKENIRPRQGLVLVVGETGSGKSTLLSSVVRSILEDPEENRVILTYEAPIEYVYDSVESHGSIVIQSEIPRHVKSFAAGVRNALRRSPEIILIGEARDRETVEAAIRAASTGHLVYSTVHANSVAETLRRVTGEFPEGSRESRMKELVSNMRMVVAQYLARGAHGGRVPIREYLTFNREVREALSDGRIDTLISDVNQLVELHGLPMARDAKDKLEQGLITKETYDLVVSGI